jgi:hypothetical protein
VSESDRVFSIFLSTSISCPKNTLRVLSLIYCYMVFQTNLGINAFLACHYEMISINFKISQSSGVLEILFFIYTRRVVEIRLIHVLYVVISSFEGRLCKWLSRICKIMQYNRIQMYIAVPISILNDYNHIFFCTFSTLKTTISSCFANQSFSGCVLPL